MDSDPVTEKDPPVRGRRRKHAGAPRSGDRQAPPREGPVFVDSSGRRARLLRRAGTALGVSCAGYAAVLGLAFMGGISLTPSQLFPFDAGPSMEAGPGPGGQLPPGYAAPPGATGATPGSAPSGGTGR